MTLIEQAKNWDETKPNYIIHAFSSDLHEIVMSAEALLAERDTLSAKLEAVTAERDELKKKYDRAVNYDFLNEALNSGDGVYRP